MNAEVYIDLPSRHSFLSKGAMIANHIDVFIAEGA
jgi:hypothetical protein